MTDGETSDVGLPWARGGTTPEQVAGVRPPVLRIVVDVDPSSSPLEGTLSAGSRAPRDFVGLVELLAGIEDLVRQSRSSA
jgi:hypothetical protein